MDEKRTYWRLEFRSQHVMLSSWLSVLCGHGDGKTGSMKPNTAPRHFFSAAM